MKLKTEKYDVADYLDSDDMIAVYLDAAFESGDTARIAEALGDVARVASPRTSPCSARRFAKRASPTPRCAPSSAPRRNR